MSDQCRDVGIKTTASTPVLHFCSIAEVFRQVSGFYFRADRETRLWQEGYYDHILRDEDATIAVARYIVLNPVRAGLCADASTYPLTGSTRYELAQLLTAAEWYPPSRR